ncbi:MAG: hypothetical protein AAF483_20540 [Planctomycetota bacterium]
MTDPAADKSNKPSSKDKILGSRGLILLMLFGVTGFLGIPVLLMSPAFSKAEKAIWSLVITIYTCVLIGLTGWVVWWSIGRIFGF